MRLIEPVRNFYSRFERPISSFSLVLGFVVDALTLKRVDNVFENLVIFIYLIVIGTFIILIHSTESVAGAEKDPSKAHFWYINILQFAFGGVFSAFLVLYFRSADILVAWPFIALLVIIFIANELLKAHYVRLSFQISLFFLSIYWFAIFLVPVVLRKIGTGIFLLSGLVSLAFILLFIFILFRFVKDKFSKSKSLLVLLISSVLLIVNFLYFTNLIPPIPLSLKDAGVFHSIEKTKDGNYLATYEDYDWRKYFILYPNFKKTSGAPVYAWSAVFSPKDLDLVILHEWQRYDKLKREWITESMISLPIVGGRDRGFRTYSTKSSNLSTDKWRVNIKTMEDKIIGRLRFNIVETDVSPELKTVVK